MSNIQLSILLAQAFAVLLPLYPASIKYKGIALAFPPLLVLCRAQVCWLHQQKWFALIKKYGN